MEISARKSPHYYDYVIVGSGIGGLLIAASLSKISSNILLIDSSDYMGGQNKTQNNQIIKINNGLRFLPSTDLSLKAIEFVEALLETSIGAISIENSPLTYESSALKPFVGFGDQSPAFYDDLAYFLSQNELSLSLQPHAWIEILSEKILSRIPEKNWMPRSYVTKFHEENGIITSLTINGHKNIHGHNFIFSGNPKDLLLLLPESGLNHKTRQKLAKSKMWTAVCLDLFHNQKISDSQSLHVLNGTTQDEVGPCVGRFFSTDNGQYSQWLSFIDSEDSENEELIGQALKKIKRQIKRAYPEALEHLKFERILVAPSVGGNLEFKLNSNQTLPAYQNFWITSGLLNTQKNLLGTILQAELVTSALSCHPLTGLVYPILEKMEKNP